MIKVLQVIGSMNYGGIESVIMNFYSHIDREQVQFDFISGPAPGRFDKVAESLGAHVYHLPVKSRHPLRYVKQLSKIVSENGYDIVHSNTNSASAFLDLWAAKRGKCKCRIAHSHNSSCIVKWQHYLLKPFLPLVVTDRLACSDAAAKWLFRKKDPYVILPNAIDFKKFDYDPQVRKTIRAELGLDQDGQEFAIGHIGSFQERKNQKFLVSLMPEILKSIKNTRLIFVGEGETKQSVYELCTELNVADKVIFLGNRSDVEKVLQAFDVFAFPSQFEGMSVAYLEAACSGLPVVVSDTIPAAAIADNIFRLPLQKDLWIDKILSFRNRERSSVLKSIADSEYNIDVAAEKLVDFYRSALKL